MMRKFAAAATLLLAVSVAAPAWASAGLPKLATLQLDKAKATLYNDSPTLLTGSNTLTLEIADLPEGLLVDLKLVGPEGQIIPVDLRPLTITEGPADAHGGDAHAEGDDHAEATDDHSEAADSHDQPADSHGNEVQDSHDEPQLDDHAAAEADDHAAAGYNVRGKVSVPTTGHWKVVVELKDAHGVAASAQAEVEVERGGPSRVYLGFTGLLMGGTAVYSLIERRRQSTRGEVAKQNGR